MSSVVISGDSSGAITVSAPAVAGTNTLTLQAGTATNSMNTRGTAVASTSGTSIDFTGLPDWVKKITVMFAGVSTSGTSPTIIQLGYQSPVTSSGYSSYSSQLTAAAASSSSQTAGFAVTYSTNVAANALSGLSTICTLGSNVWVFNSTASHTDRLQVGGGSITLGGTLDRIRITTAGGTDTFDAGSINILYEG
jgi:hypothetical protein